MSSKITTLGVMFLAAILLIGLIPVRATAKGKPDWVEQPAALYPSSNFMVGVGEGADVEEAKAKALAEISSIFNSEIKQVVESRDMMIDTNGEVSSESELKVETQLVTAAAFEGAEVKQRWCCQSGKHFVLTVLERSTYRQSLADRMNSFEADIAQTLAGLETAETPLEIARLSMNTLTPAQNRDKLLGQYRVVSGKPWQPKPTTATLRRMRVKAIDDTTFVVEAKVYEEAKDRERRNSALALAMREVVNEHEFKLASRGRATMKLACTLNLAEPFQRSAGAWFEYTWDASCEIGADTPGARVMLVAEESDTVSASSEGASKKKAMTQSKNAMLRRVRKELNNYLAQGS